EVYLPVCLALCHYRVRGMAGPSLIPVALCVPEMSSTSSASGTVPIFSGSESFPWFYSLRSFQWEFMRQKNSTNSSCHL
ncbi:mCG145155, partial [Mus musculus]